MLEAFPPPGHPHLLPAIPASLTSAALLGLRFVYNCDPESVDRKRKIVLGGPDLIR